MSELATSRTDLDQLRAICELVEQQADEAGSALAVAALLERLLGCECVVTLADEAVRVLPRNQTGRARRATEVVIQGDVDGVVRAEIALRRAPDRPFDEREVLLCDLLRPHLATWLSHLGDSRAQAGRALTDRQVEILGLARCGMSNKEIARALGLTRATVSKHLENAFVRLGVASRTAAVAAAFTTGTATEAGHV